MWRPGPRLWPRCLSWGLPCWKGWMRPGLPIFAVALLVTVPGCSSASSILEPDRTVQVPALPVLTSLQRLELNGTPGIWMNSDDAGRLAIWIYDVTGTQGDAPR